MDGGRGGDALFLAAGTEAVTLETTFTPGPSGGAPLGWCSQGSPGTTLAGTGTHTVLSRSTGRCRVASPISRGSPVELEIVGPPGFGAFLTLSRELEPVFVPERMGYSVVDPSSPVLSLGTLPSTGVLTITVPSPALEPFEQAAVYYLQAKLYDPVATTASLGAPTTLFVVRNTCR